MSNKVPKTREELALGAIDPKTGKRKGGFIVAQRKMKQNQEALAAGTLSEDELIEKAFRAADNYLARQQAAGNSGDPFAEDDLEYREEQKGRYLDLYEWNGANDLAALEQLLDLEVQSRATNREFSRASLNIKDRTSLLGELRNIAKDHSTLQQKLGIDRISRENKARNEDPMQALRTEIESGAAKMQALVEEGPAAWRECNTEEELAALIKHHLGFPYAIVRPLLAEHKRILGVSSDSTVVEE